MNDGHTMLPRYSPGTLPGAVKSRNGHTTLHYRACSQCGQMHKRTSQYCSSACKQRAYRQRKDPQCNTFERRRQRSNRAVQTKHWVQKTIVCAHCGDERHFSVSASTNRLYCSDACKQAAYRKRRSANK